MEGMICYNCLGLPLEKKCVECFESTSKCFCPFCGSNCYSIAQMEQHIQAKIRWETSGLSTKREFNHQKLKISHSGGTSVILINKQIDMCNQEDSRLEAKFDALTEHLGVEFVFETISDESGDETRVFARKKSKKK